MKHYYQTSVIISLCEQGQQIVQWQSGQSVVIRWRCRWQRTGDVSPPFYNTSMLAPIKLTNSPHAHPWPANYVVPSTSQSVTNALTHGTFKITFPDRGYY